MTFCFFNVITVPNSEDLIIVPFSVWFYLLCAVFQKLGWKRLIFFNVSSIWIPTEYSSIFVIFEGTTQI